MDYLLQEVLSLILTSFLVLHFQTGQPIGQVQKKQKEIQRQVVEFLQKGFVREVLACFVPVILVQRKMGHNACVQMTEP